jgi:SAM-dependent methyltransferase
VEDVDYAATFGDQWNRYRRTQLDSATGRPHSRRRLLEGTGWPELGGEIVLEVGCGAGRFTEILLDLGAEVWATDATTAIDACATNNWPNPRLVLLQADLFALPLRPGSFDRVFCYGVLQHTPDPARAFHALVEQVKPGGFLAADVYERSRRLDRWASKRIWRPVTTRLPPGMLRRIVEWYVPRWLPIDRRLARIPKLGRFLVALVPCWNYEGLLDLAPDQLEAWAVLDTFDALSPRYDEPQTLAAVESWCRDAGLEEFDVRRGGNGILVNARRPR